jgi:hypothetical protein
MRLNTFFLVIGIAFLGLSSNAQTVGTSSNKPSPKVDTQWLQGEWRGVAYQVDGSNWDVVLVNDSTGLIKVSYPTLGCVGTWESIAIDLNRIVLKETIVEGKSNCDQSSSVILNKVTDTHISLAYFLPNQPERVIAYTVLTKL